MRAEERGKTPASRAIMVRPNALDKDEPRFKSAWIMAIEKAEKSLMTMLQNSDTQGKK